MPKASIKLSNSYRVRWWASRLSMQDLVASLVADEITAVIAEICEGDAIFHLTYRLIALVAQAAPPHPAVAHGQHPLAIGTQRDEVQIRSTGSSYYFAAEPLWHIVVPPPAINEDHEP